MINKNPLKRNYFVKNNVVYNINNSSDLLLNNNKINENILPKIEVREITSKIDIKTDKNITKTHIFYIDSLIEDGCLYENNEFKKDNDVSMHNYFLSKCHDKIKNWIYNNPNDTKEVLKKINGTGIPNWMIKDYKENNGSTYEIITNGITAIDIDSEFITIKTEMCEEKVKEYYEKLSEEFGIDKKNITFN